MRSCYICFYFCMNFSLQLCFAFDGDYPEIETSQSDSLYTEISLDYFNLSAPMMTNFSNFNLAEKHDP